MGRWKGRGQGSRLQQSRIGSNPGTQAWRRGSSQCEMQWQQGSIRAGKGNPAATPPWAPTCWGSVHTGHRRPKAQQAAAKQQPCPARDHTPRLLFRMDSLTPGRVPTGHLKTDVDTPKSQSARWNTPTKDSVCGDGWGRTVNTTLPRGQRLPRCRGFGHQWPQDSVPSGYAPGLNIYGLVPGQPLDQGVG